MSDALARRGWKGGQDMHRRDDRLIYLMYLVVFILVALYILHNNFLIGLAALLAIVATIALEFRGSIRSEGIKKTARDLIIAVVAVVILIWILPTILLQSQSPIDVVASCSMLPSLQRGDLILVHGIGNMSQFLHGNHIPIVNASRQQFNDMINNMGSEFLEPFAYSNGNKNDLLQYIGSNNSNYELGLYSLPCLGRAGYAVSCFASSAAQESNLIKYNYTVGNVTVGQQRMKIAEIGSITIANTTIYENYSNPVIVYRTIPEDSFYNDQEIIHRLYAVIDVNGSYYMVTKGDNNPVIDIQAGNYPAGASDVVGYLYASVPYLGYPSLIIKGQLGAVQGCNQTILR